MSTHMDNIRRMAELEAERDAALEQVIYWRERAVGAEAERDALAAHVERMRDVWQRLHLRSPVHVEVLKAYSHVMRDTPTTSLARLRAEWQAEALERLKTRYCKEKGSLFALVDDEIEQLRRQAEGGHHD